jgi:sporulation protein YlmC with PRC-barrel domain
MSTTPTRVFAARLSGLPVFDPQGDQVGKVRDVVVVLLSDVRQPRVVGLVV